LKSKGLKRKYQTIVGGAPVTQRWADWIGADAYAEDAGEAVRKATQLLGMKVILLTEVALRKKVIALWM
jgi:trimethylamine corrinoid protein